ncbi:Fe-S cluster biogenesis protein NfuA [Micromonospora polyrhachis]|uniref:Fe-S cluster biogenesis protein NfuA n=1 Tax=Micromonospora polyrhachis TaxID=1282883 RepID=A0A7W7SKR8_9ACTN|nr:Fe-S cluster biogenesis protein NfuA [Micromonospora polyrhachis]
MRWIIPAGLLSVTGAVAAAPVPLATLLADGTLAEIVVEPAAVMTRLGHGRSWSTDAPRVRTAIHAALEEPAGWIAANEPDSSGVDALLYPVVQGLLDGAVGQYARSHGGRIDLVDVRDGVVTVRLTGTCHGCPAAHLTLRHRLERDLRRWYPAVRVVDAGRAPVDRRAPRSDDAPVLRRR